MAGPKSNPHVPSRADPKSAILGLLGSLVLLIAFLALKAFKSQLVELPISYLLVALVPTVVGLIVGGYVKDLKAGGVEVGFNIPPELEKNSTDVPAAGSVQPKKGLASAAAGWAATQYRAIYEGATHHYMLAHVYRPSAVPGQKFDVFIFVVRHERGSPTGPREDLPEVEKAEFCFGPSWNDEVFDATPNQGRPLFAVRTQAYGTFLCICRITVTIPETKERQEILLHRFIDFSMAPPGES